MALPLRIAGEDIARHTTDTKTSARVLPARRTSIIVRICRIPALVSDVSVDSKDSEEMASGDNVKISTIALSMRTKYIYYSERAISP